MDIQYHGQRSKKRKIQANVSVVVAITDGKLDFGLWERIFYGESDGDRRKQLRVKIIGQRLDNNDLKINRFFL
jgi:thiamine phosphate synthase YjbQ (UPF0047 family)